MCGAGLVHVDIDLAVVSLRNAELPVGLADTVRLQSAFAHRAEVYLRGLDDRLARAEQKRRDIGAIQRLSWKRKIAERRECRQNVEVRCRFIAHGSFGDCTGQLCNQWYAETSFPCGRFAAAKIAGGALEPWAMIAGEQD